MEQPVADKSSDMESASPEATNSPSIEELNSSDEQPGAVTKPTLANDEPPAIGADPTLDIAGIIESNIASTATDADLVTGNKPIELESTEKTETTNTLTPDSEPVQQVEPLNYQGEFPDTDNNDVQTEVVEMDLDPQEIEADQNSEQAVPVEESLITPSENISLATPVYPLGGSESPKYLETNQTPIDEFITTEEDLEALSAFYSISVDILQNNKSLFISLLMKFKEFENLKSNNQVLQINYEQLQHTQKRKVEHVKSELSSAIAEINNLNDSKLKILKEKEELESTLKNISGSKDKSVRLVEDLKSRITELETSKSYVSDLLEAKQSQIDDLNQEIKVLVEENRGVRKTMLEIETSKESLNTELLTFKLNAAKFENEVHLLTSSRDWYENELNSKIKEFDEFRSEQGKRLSQTVSELNSIKQDSEIATSSLNSYKAEVEKLTTQRQEYQFQIKELSDKLAVQESQYMSTISRRDEHIQVLEKSLSDKTQRIESLDKLYKETYDKVKLDEEEYKKKFEELESQIVSKEAKIRELESTVNNITETSMVSNEGFQVSSFVHKTLNDMNSELSLTDLLEELNLLKKQVLMERRAKIKAETELSNILKELQRKMPLLNSYEEKLENFKREEQLLKNMVGTLTNENKNISKTCDVLKKKVTESELQIRNLAKYKIDLQKQLVVLLSEMQFKQCGESPLTLEEKDYINKVVSNFGELKDLDENDTDRLISARLTTFKETAELIKKNEDLLIVSRKLASELESKENGTGGMIEGVETETIQKARAAINKLQEKVKNLETQLEAAINGRDILQNLFDSGVAKVGDHSDKQATVDRINSLLEEVKSKKEELATIRKSYDEKIFDLNIKVQKTESEKAEIKLKLSQEVSSNALNQEKINNLNSTINFIKQESAQLKSMIEKNHKNAAVFETKLQAANDELIKKNSAVINFEIQVKTLTAEKNVWKSVEEELRKEVTKLYNEKAESNERFISLQTLDGERQAHFKEALQRFTNTQDALQREIDTLREKLEKSNSEISNILHSKNVDSKVYQKRIDLLTEELSINKELIVSKEKLVNDLENELTLMKKKQIALDERKQNVLTSMASATDSDNVSVLKEELKNALEDLDVAVRESAQYKELSSSAEKQLSILNENYTQYKAVSDQKIASLRENLDVVKTNIAELEEEKEKLALDFNHLQQTSEISKQEYVAKIEELNAAISGFDSIKSDYDAKVALVKSELEEKEKNISQLNHLIVDKDNQIGALEAISSLTKKEVEELKSKLAQSEEAIVQKEMMIEEAKLKNKDSISQLEQNLRNDKIRISELEAQNRTLLNQLEESPLAFGESDDMKNLVAYLNREKDSLSQQLSYVQGEESILRQNINSKEKEIVDLKSELAVVKEKSSTIDKYSELLANMKGEVEELRVYKENNAGLRDQIKLYETRITELESQINQVSSEYSAANSNTDELKKHIEAVTAENAGLREQVSSLKQGLEESSKNITSAEELATKNNLIQELEARLKEKDQIVSRMKAEFIDKLKKKSAEKNQIEEELKKAVEKVTTLEKQSNDNNNNNNNNNTFGSANDEVVNSLKAEIESLKEQIQNKTTENNTISQNGIEQLRKVTAEMDVLKNELAAVKSSSDSVNSQPKDLAAVEKKYIEEKEALLKQLQELKSNSSSTSDEELEKLKESLKAEYKAAADTEVQNQKMKYQAKLNGIIEKRVQSYKDQVKQYEASVEELKKKLAGGSDSSKMEELLKKFEAEKEELKKETRAAVEKEKAFKEKLMQGKINRLEEEVKKLQQNAPPTPTNGITMPMNMMPMGNFGSMSNMSNLPNMSNMPNMPSMPNMSMANMPNMAHMPNMNFNFQQPKSAFGNSGNAAVQSNPFTPKKIPSKPTKRSLEESNEPEKRKKTD